MGTIELKIAEVSGKYKAFALPLLDTIYLTQRFRRDSIDDLVDAIVHETVHVVLFHKISPEASSKYDEVAKIVFFSGRAEDLR